MVVFRIFVSRFLLRSIIVVAAGVRVLSLEYARRAYHCHVICMRYYCTTPSLQQESYVMQQ